MYLVNWVSHSVMESWVTDYAADHAEINRQKELQRSIHHFQSPQLQFRTHLVTWIQSISESMKFTLNTVHLAVYILDIFMDNHQIDVDRLHLVALVCLSTAAKYEERDARIPKVCDLMDLIHNRHSPSQFRELEWMLLRFLDWRLDFPTVAVFANYYSLFAVTKNDWNASEFASYQAFWNAAQQAVKEYLDLSLLDVTLLHYLPSTVACACILLARQQLRLSVKWTDKLLSITRYTFDDIVRCANNVLSRSRCPDLKRKLADSPDHGYASGCDSSPDAKASNQRVKVRKRL